MVKGDDDDEENEGSGMGPIILNFLTPAFLLLLLRVLLVLVLPFSDTT